MLTITTLPVRPTHVELVCSTCGQCLICWTTAEGTHKVRPCSICTTQAVHEDRDLHGRRAA